MTGGALTDDGPAGCDPRRPFAVPAFRLLWTATVLANVTALAQTVAAAWMMVTVGTGLQVALIQSAIAAPVMIFAFAAGAIADIVDRTRLMLLAFGLMLAASLLLAVATFAGAAGPSTLLGLCCLFGCGSALFGPAGMAAVNDYLPRRMMPEGVASLGIAFNLARCVGPALGGAMVGVAGPGPTFALNAVGSIAMILLLCRAPCSSAAQAARGSLRLLIREGIGFAARDSDMRGLLLRIMAFTAAASPIWALLPLVVLQQLGGTSFAYGVLMSAMGGGAITFSFVLPALRKRFALDRLMRLSASLVAVSLVLLAITRDMAPAAILLFLAGGGWVVTLTACNIALQLKAPERLVGRAIGAFYTAVFGGLAAGSWLWGHVAEGHGLAIALGAAGFVIAGSIVVDLRWPIRSQSDPIERADSAG